MNGAQYGRGGPGDSGPSVDQRSDTLSAAAHHAPVELRTLTPHESDLWHDGYLWGNVHGIEKGRELADAEAAAIFRLAVQQVQRVAKQPTYRDLCERRGEPDHAARAREHELRILGMFRV